MRCESPSSSVILIPLTVVARNEIEDFHSRFSVAADHRDDYIPIPPSHSRYLLISSLPSADYVNLKLWRVAANISGYTIEGSYRYDHGQQYCVRHSRLLGYYSDDHAARDGRYNGSWIVTPPLSNGEDQKRLWLSASRLLGRCRGLHPQHRRRNCTTPDEVQGAMYVFSWASPSLL